jgi:hypothetical protein
MNHHRDLRLARALYQLTIYFDSLNIPFTLPDLYEQAYGSGWTEMPGALWLPHLADDPYVVAGRHEFYTLKTIFEDMERAGLSLLLEVIAEETARLGIRMGIITPGVYRRRPPQSGEDPEPS